MNWQAVVIPGSVLLDEASALWQSENHGAWWPGLGVMAFRGKFNRCALILAPSHSH